MNFEQFQDFEEYCKKTRQTPDEAIKTIIENIDNFSKEISKFKKQKN